MPAPAPISIADAHAQLTAPGSPFEMEIVDIDGRPTKTWKNAMPSIRALLEASRAHFVLDLNRYRQADHKIGRVGTATTTAIVGQFSSLAESEGCRAPPVPTRSPEQNRACGSGRRSPVPLAGSSTSRARSRPNKPMTAPW